jgi:hypothetical protein
MGCESIWRINIDEGERDSESISLPNSFIESHAAFYLEQSRAVVSGQRQRGRVQFQVFHTSLESYAITMEAPRVLLRSLIKSQTFGADSPFFAKATKGILRFESLLQWPAIRSFRHGSEEWRNGRDCLRCTPAKPIWLALLA